MNRREEKTRPAAEIVCSDDIHRPVEITTVQNHKLHLIGRMKIADILPVIGMLVTAAGTFDVHDADDPTIQLMDGKATARFDQHRVAEIAQSLRQRIDLLLHERFAAGDFYQVTPIALHLADDLVHGHPVTAIKSVLRVAPATAKRTPGEPDKHTGQSGVGGLPLNRIKNFRDSHRPVTRENFGIDRNDDSTRNHPSMDFLAMINGAQLTKISPRDERLP